MAAPRCTCGEAAWNDDGRCKACLRFPTLGYEVGHWIEARCAVPDRDQVGEPYILTDEQWRFLLNFYRLDPHAKLAPGRRLWKMPFTYARGAQLVRPQKWGKGPFSGAIICAEAAGPTVFDGWSAEGLPVGRPQASPLVQVTASSVDQTDNVWMSLLPMISLGDFGAEIPETGLQRIYLPNGGYIEPVTSAARSRLGQRVTFIVQDQTESWTAHNGGRSLADTQRRNIAGMGGRWLSTCNAWDPAEDSVAQYTAEHEAAQGDVWHDDVTPPENLSVRNKVDRRKALKLVYGDSWWVDLDRVDSEIVALLPRDPAQAERWFLNRKSATESAAFDGEKWDSLADPDSRPETGAFIVLGIDGARYDDALAIVATEVETGFQWPIGIWEKPPEVDDDYEHPMDEVDGALDEVFETYAVWRAYIDPGSTAGNITALVDRWQNKYGAKRVLTWLMNRPRATAQAVANYTQAIGTGDLAHDGDPVLARHVKNARKQKVNVHDERGRRMHVISKDRPESPHKMDGAAAGVLSWEARGDAIASGARAPNRGKTYTF
jgi:hypothetical protein